MAEKRPAFFSSLEREILMVITLTGANLLSTFQIGGLTIALPTIEQEFSMTQELLQWILSAYTLAFGCILLLVGRLSDLFGRKRIFMIGCAWMTVFAVICSVSQSATMLIIARALQGAGASLTIPSSVGILGSCYAPGERRNKAFAAFSAGAPIGFVMGLIFGGVYTQDVGWRWMFYTTAALSLAFCVSGFLFVPHHEGQKGGDRRIDIVGAILSTVALMLFTYALSEAEFSSNGWTTPYILAFLICSVAIFAGFLLFESRIDYPIMPLTIWKYRRFALVNFVAFCGWGAFNAFLFYATLFFQNIQTTTPLQTTARFIPMAISGISVNVVMAVTINKIPARYLLMVAMAAFTASAVLFALSAPDQSYWSMPLPALLLCVVGADTLYCVSSLFVMTTVRPEDQSVASGVLNTVLSIGVSVALAATSAMAGSQAGPNDTTPLESYRAAFWTCAGITGLGFLAATVGADIGIVGESKPAANAKKGPDVEEIAVGGRDDATVV
ncbi:major facilitator superfamily-domain-containing protein [Blyttiomyces helicus]|uniref:Major facilitator superfamily-domain-containing protein n=1 Tax=Blyttiomyces helicus TaxID=388810 RepID=A0A4P9WIH8_9FUNG|nr:major facilitator superfamily-domain-containing protein [Blyttiomyces helicus]|eukprot:RKO92584.1 major facilitator superfamily-domain-containing protein [Blyttiomyces helicus]